MRNLILIFIFSIVGISFAYSQDVVKCKKQKELVAEKTQLIEKYGEEFVDNALKGELVVGMPKDLFLSAFNTKSVNNDSTEFDVFEVYNDRILQRLGPGMNKPTPLFLVKTSNNQIVEIQPYADSNQNYKKSKGLVIY